MMILTGIITNFFKHQCLSKAENIAFCALLAMIPIAMLVVSIAGYFLGISNDALVLIANMATDFFPVGREFFIANLQSIVDQRSSLSIFSVIFLIFVAMILMATIERMLDDIFDTVSRRNFFHSRLLGIAIIFWVTLLFSLPPMVSILETLFHNYGFGIPLSAWMTGKVYFFLVALFSYTMMILIIPNRKIYFRYAFAGGIFFAIGIVCARLIYQWYMAFAIDRYNIIYGSLSAVILFLIWIYYMSVVILLAAEVVAQLQFSLCFHKRLKSS